MAVRSITMDFAGQTDVQPRRGCMVTTDSLNTITTAGYLNNQPQSAGINFYANDFMFVNYDAPSNGAIGGSTGIFNLSISNTGVITLVNYLPDEISGVTPGESEDGKMLTLDADGELDGVAFSAYTNAASYVANIQATTIVDVETVSTTPASGSCAAQFRMVNSEGDALASIRPIFAYVSSSAGAVGAAVTGIAVLTNGALAQLVTGRCILASCSATGLFGITLTASTGSYYVTFLLPDGEVAISDELVVNA